MAYYPNGNIKSKYVKDIGTGTFSYGDDAGPHALTGTTDIPSMRQDISYTPFNKVMQITEGDYTLDFTYGLGNARKKTVLKQNNNTILTKHFFGSYETVETPDKYSQIHYLPGGAIFVKENGNTDIFYTYTDHLGSIVAVTDNAGEVIQEQSFDA